MVIKLQVVKQAILIQVFILLRGGATTHNVTDFLSDVLVISSLSPSLALGSIAPSLLGMYVTIVS